MGYDLNTIQHIQQFNSDSRVMRLQRLFKNSSILEIVGIERNETRHSKFIRWVFKMPEINTKSRYSPIMHLLDILVRRDYEQNPNKQIVPTDFGNSIINRNTSISIIDVQPEYQTEGLKFKNKKGVAKSGLIDIYITALISSEENQKVLHICIENKLYTDEHDSQTTKYYAYMTGGNDLDKDKDKIEFDKGTYKCPTKQGDIVLFAFLSPTPECIMKDKAVLDKKCECKKYIHINYQDIVNEILTPLVEDEATPDSAKKKIDQYISTLSIPGDEALENKNNKDDETLSKTVMASGKEMLILANDIYKDYKELFIKAVFDSNYSSFKTGYKDFLTNLMTTVSHSTDDDQDFLYSKLMVLRLNGKKNNYLVMHDETYHVYGQKEFAVNFAKLYCKKMAENSVLDVKMLNGVFKTVKGPTADAPLFVTPPIYNPKKTNLYDEVYDDGKGLKIYFANNIWGTGEYLPKLEDFIKQHCSKEYIIIQSPER